MTGATLADRIIGLVTDSARSSAMSGAARRLARSRMPRKAIVDRAIELIEPLEQR